MTIEEDEFKENKNKESEDENVNEAEMMSNEQNDEL